MNCEKLVRTSVLMVAMSVFAATSAVAECTVQTATSYSATASVPEVADGAGGIGTAPSPVGADAAVASAAVEPEKKKKPGFGRLLRDKVLAPATGVVIGVGVGYGCKSLGLGSAKECAAVGLAAGAGGYFLGKKLVKKLSENDQAKLLEATSAALRTGQPACLNFPDSGILADISPTGPVSYQEHQVAIGAAGENILAPTSGLKVETQAFMAPRQVALYAGPDVEWDKVGTIAAKQPVEVIGEVAGAGWLLVGARNSEEGRVAIGYAQPATLSGIGESGNTLAKEEIGAVKPLSFTAKLPCRALKVVISSTNNSETENADQVQCTAPDGSLFTPATA